MIPNKNQYVVICCKNGAKLDGFVNDWNAEYVELVNKTVSITTVIYRTEISYYQIIKVAEKFDTIKTKPNKTEEDIKRLAELKIELTDIEREEISAKLKSHEIGEVKQTNYELPSFLNVSTKQHTTEKIERRDTGVGEGLSRLFKQK